MSQGAQDAVAARVRRILAAILVVNWAVALAKLAYGALSGSVAISADGIHSLADGASNVVALLVMLVAAKPPDEGHPYGHRKFEVMGSVSIGVMIVLGMLGLARRVFLAPPSAPHVGGGGFAVVLGTLAVNVAVASYEGRAGRKLKSALLTADATHTASDVLATVSVLAAFVAERLGIAGADRMAAVFIMALIGMAAIQIFKSGIHILADAAAINPASIEAETRGVAGVVDCHKVRSRGVPGEILVDLHVQVDPAITVAEGHRIAHAVQRTLRGAFSGVIEVVVHTEPATAEQLARSRGRSPQPS